MMTRFYSKRVLVTGAFVVFFVTQSLGALILSEDFQSYSGDPTGNSGGSGDWTSAWTQGSQNSGGTYLNGSTKIDGTRTYGFFGSGGAEGTSRNRGFTSTTTPVTFQFSFRADYDVIAGAAGYDGRIAFTLRNGNSTDHFAGQRLSFFFAEGNSSLQWFDGADHTLSGITFATGAIYDFSVTVDPSSRAYSFTAAQRGGSSSSSSGNWSLGSNGDSLDSLALFMRGPSGGGNDAFFDSISAVPEPANVALGIFGGVAALAGGVRFWRSKKSGGSLN